MEVAGAQAAHLSYSIILSLLRPWVSYFVSLQITLVIHNLVITWVNYFACFPVQKWNSLWGGTTVNHKEHKLSFQNVLCPRDLIINCQIPSLCPYIFGSLWEGLMIQPRFLRSSFVLSLAGHGAGKEILMCFSQMRCCWCSDSRTLTFFAWNYPHWYCYVCLVQGTSKKKGTEQSLKLRHRWGPHGSSSNPLKAGLYVWLPWCVEKAK